MAHRRIETALSLFDEGVPQQARELLAYMEGGSDPMPESPRFKCGCEDCPEPLGCDEEEGDPYA